MKRTYVEMLIAELEATDKLARGWVKGNCATCEGTGVLKKTIKGTEISAPCPVCNGSGFNWEPPATKDL